MATPVQSASLASPHPRAMTRCECAGVSFEEIARRIREEGWSLVEATCRTGCGRTCTACVPDLTRYLADVPPRP